MQFSDKLLSDAEICYQDVQENAICIQKTNLQQRNALKGDAFFFSQNFTARPSPPSQQPRRMKHLQPAVADADIGGHMQHHDRPARPEGPASPTLPGPAGSGRGRPPPFLGPSGFSLPPKLPVPPPPGGAARPRLAPSRGRCGCGAGAGLEAGAGAGPGPGAEPGAGIEMPG